MDVFETLNFSEGFTNYSLIVLRRDDVEKLYRQSDLFSIPGNDLHPNLENNVLTFLRPTSLGELTKTTGLLLVGDIDFDTLKTYITNYANLINPPIIDGLGFDGKGLNIPKMWLPYTYAPMGNFSNANLSGANLMGFRIAAGNLYCTNFAGAVLQDAMLSDTCLGFQNSGTRSNLTLTRYEDGMRGPFFIGELDYSMRQ